MKGLKLYIDSKLVDLNDDSLVVMNYTAEELSNPTIVKNAYSQQISIPATPNNNEIFGNIYRLDRSTLLSSGYSGVSFNPLVRTPFAIYNDLGQMVESGYVKLDSIKRVGANITYSISLYGGLGQFFYSLSYNDEGDKLTLADLEYINGSEGELDFNINASNVSNAWGVIGGTVPPNNAQTKKWQVLNFLPAYTGIPEDFDADKAVANLSGGAFGMVATQKDGDTTYYPLNYEDGDRDNNWTLINLGKEHTGEDMKEFRSYLQRPIISFKRVLTAIKDLAESKGFGLTLDADFFNDNNPYYAKSWMLLPPMTSLEIQTDSKEGTLSGKNNQIAVNRTIPLQFSDDISVINGEITISGEATMSAQARSEYNDGFIIPIFDLQFYNPKNDDNITCVMQLIGTMEDGEQVGSDLVVFNDADSPKSAHDLLADMADNSGYTAVGGEGKFLTAKTCTGHFEYNGRWIGEKAEFAIEGSKFKSVELRVTWNKSAPVMYAKHSEGNFELVRLTNNRVTFNGSFNIQSKEGTRTNSLISKKSLLRSEHTPIDYLISYAKTFGLVFSYDKATNNITLQARDTWYQGGDFIDLSKRIDYSQAVNISPNMIDARYLEFNNEGEGAFLKDVEQQQGRPYASTRVDTGSAFNKETKTAIDNNAFKGAAEVCRRSKYNTDIEQGGKYVPSVFIDADVKYTLYSGGESKEFPVTTPNNTATITYHNSDYPTYDKDSRLQLHDKEDKPLDITDVLVFYRGTPRDTDKAYQRFRITDDNAYMSILNEGKPCWNLGDMGGILNPSLPVPSFGRYIFNGENPKEITHSLDFGIPQQIDIPNVTHSEGANVYARGWHRYLSDQYNVDTRVVRAKVDLRGLQVGESLLRNFYFFEGAYWVMNRIINYSLTSNAPVECEFIKVHDTENYTSGQNY